LFLSYAHYSDEIFIMEGDSKAVGIGLGVGLGGFVVVVCICSKEAKTV
jgi:hypothetical protein